MVRAWIGWGVGHILWVSILLLWLTAIAAAQTETAAQLEKQASELYKAAKYGDALAAAERWVHLAERNTENKSALAASLGHLAWYALFAKQHEKALAASERALKLGPYNLSIETNHAHALLFLGRTEEARSIYLGHKGERTGKEEKWEAVIAQDFRELRAGGLDHPAMTAIEKALGNAADSPLAQSTAELDTLHSQFVQLNGQKKYAEAIPLAKRLLAARERTLGREHPDTLSSASDLAWLYEDQGRYGEAEPFRRRALEASERVLGREHPDTLTSVSNLGWLYEAQGRYNEAEPLYRRALEARERVLGREHPDTLISVSNLAELYRMQGRHGEAEPLNRRALETRERLLGRDHPDTLNSINNLAALYEDQGRYGEAEPLYRRAVEAFERVFGREHPDTLTCVSNLAALYESQGRHDEAEPLLRRVLETRERVLGRDHPDTITTINNLAGLYGNQGRYGEAEPLHRRAQEAFERVLGADHPLALTSTGNLAGLYMDQGRYSEAEPLYRRVLDVRERMLGAEHPDTLDSINNLAALYGSQGRYSEAELLFRRTLEARERVLGLEHSDTLTSVNNLAWLYEAQGRHSEAEPLYRRALEARERVLGREHPDTLGSINSLAALYEAQGRYGEAELLFRRVLKARERVLGREHPDTLASAHNLAAVYKAQRRYGEAEPLLRRVVDARQRILGREHPYTLSSLSNLGSLYYHQGRYGEAEPLYRRALEAQERVLGREHPDTLVSVNNLAMLYFAQRDWPRAATMWRRSTASIAARTLRGTQESGVRGKTRSESERLNWQFWGLVKVAYRLAPEGRGPDAPAMHEMFQTAQWALPSEAAQSLAQMASRGARADGALAVPVRERQDLVAEWQKLDTWRNAALSREAAKRDAKAEAENAARLAAIDARIAEIDKRLAGEFPDYAALASPTPSSVEEVQAQLADDEALVLFLDTDNRWNPVVPEETFIWVVTRTDVRWVRSDVGTVALTREAQALRCGLDADAWRGPRCSDLTGKKLTHEEALAAKALPFDLARAHGLYKALFGQVEDLIKGKHLLIVPSGPLTQLPFQVLVTAPPAGGDQVFAGRDQTSIATKAAAWLVRGHAITILPAVSSLKALRRTARPTTSTKPMIGFGNPLLDGDKSDRNDRTRAEYARACQSCDSPAVQRIAAALGLRRNVTPVGMRGADATAAHVRAQTPLPESATELCTVARDLKADPAEMRLGARATEHEIKKLSEHGQLAQYRIVHFATHGALAGELKGTSEPGLLLTPPDAASEEDDGYLSASEIAGLKLDADWVILSACNTAAGDATGAQALSGLARAFIYAQARALLVSHWPVDSGATVKLITTAMREMTSDGGVGRAEALRRAMLALIDKGEAKETHPAYWAPFVVVGEGAR